METGNIRSYGRPQGRGINLHLGCGDYWFEGFLNIDNVPYGGTDMIFDIREKLPFQDSVVERIEAYEVVEHFSRGEINNMLDDWNRLLIEGGTIRISVPDMDELVSQYGNNKEKVIEYMYGFDGMGHKWGYNEETIKKLFEEHGFKDIEVEKGKLPERPDEDKLILTCKK